MLKEILLTVINFIKYPFLGLFFVVYNIIKFIFNFVVCVIKGICYVFYLIVLPFRKLYELLNKKDNKKGKTIDGIINSNKKEEKIVVLNEKEQLKAEQRRIAREEKQKLKEERLAKKAEIREQRKKELEERKRIKREQYELKNKDKIEQRRIAREEKQKLKEERLAKKAEIREQRRKELEERKRIRQEQIDLNKKEKAEQRRIALEEKQKQKLEQIEKKRQLQEQKQKLKEEKRQKALQENVETNNVQSEKIDKKEQKRLERERKEQLKKEELEKKAALEIQKEQEKEQLVIKKLEEREERKREKERVKQAKRELREQRKQLPFNQRMAAFFKFIPTIPALIVKKISDWFNKLPFVKNAKNKRDINRQALMLDLEGKDAEKNSKKIVYVYEAKNPEGKIVKERFSAYSKVEVHSFLLSEGYEVYSIKTNPLIQLLFSESGSPKFKTKDLVFFLTQLSTYLKAGIPLVDSLKILSRQYKQRTYKNIFRTIIYDLSTGESFSSAMTKQGTTFPRLLINMVKAAELTGELTEALDDMAEYYTQTEKTKKQMVNAMMYPTIVFIISIAVITFILIFVIPKFTQMYSSIDPSKIPAFTKAVIAVSDFIKANILFIFIGIVVFIVLFIILYKKVTTFRTIMQWLLMHLPVVGNVIIYNEVTMFTKTFASLLSHNVYITDSMEILNKITNNEIYKMIILDTVTNLAKGEKISLAFKDHWAFPIPAYEMLVTGESTGQLAEMMLKVSVYYQDLHSDVVSKIKTLLEPVLLVFLTTVVGIIVLAIVIPMFNLYQTIQQI